MNHYILLLFFVTIIVLISSFLIKVLYKKIKYEIETKQYNKFLENFVFTVSLLILISILGFFFYSATLYLFSEQDLDQTDEWGHLIKRTNVIKMKGNVLTTASGKTYELRFYGKKAYQGKQRKEARKLLLNNYVHICSKKIVTSDWSRGYNYQNN